MYVFSCLEKFVDMYIYICDRLWHICFYFTQSMPLPTALPVTILLALHTVSLRRLEWTLVQGVKKCSDAAAKLARTRRQAALFCAHNHLMPQRTNERCTVGHTYVQVHLSMCRI